MTTHCLTKLACTLFVASSLSASSATFAQSSEAQSYPNRPVTVIVPFPPGGGTDIGGRIVMQKLSVIWGQTVIVENRGGAAGLLGAEAVAKAKPDGYTLLVGNVGTQSVNPALYAKMPYNPDTAFQPITMIAELPLVLLVTPSLPYRSVQELIAAAKAEPGKLSYASSGAGGAPHLAAEILKTSAGIEVLHVPYKGGGPAVADLMAGHVASTVQPLGTMLAQARANRLVVLASSGARRSSLAPEVPTFAELGHAGFNGDLWFGVFAPPGMPAERAESLNAIFTQTMRRAQVRERMRALDLDARESSAAEFAAQVKTDWRRWSEVIKSTGFTGESE